MSEEIGFVYGFDAKDLHNLRPVIFWQRFHSIATESRREFAVMQEELAKQANGPNIDAKFVRMSVLGAEKGMPQTSAKLRTQFGSYQLFYIANRTVYELFQRDSNFSSLGKIGASAITENPREKLAAESFPGHNFLSSQI